MSIYLPSINEKKSKTAKLMEQLDSISLGKMYQAAFKALLRLQIYFIGRTEELILEFQDKAEGMILKAGGADQIIDGTAGLLLQTDLAKAWGNTWSDWTEEFQQARHEAGMIAFGVAAVFHDRLILPAVTKLEEAGGVVDGVYEPQLKLLLDVAENYLHGDAINLSGRIWKIDRDTRDGINAVLMKGIADGNSAWNIAKDLEQYLGSDADCPRWTKQRLYGLTKTEIAQGDTTGLLSRPKGAAPGSLTAVLVENPCTGKGVSYNALRLARTEIQKIHALATDRMLARQPWVEQEKVNTSPSHGEPDECDDVAAGGEKNDGVYPVGTIELPLHPNCLCFKTAVLMEEKEFTSKLNGWLKGGEDWEEMDSYANDLGVDLSVSHAPATLNLAVWLFGENLEKWIQ
jgi:hypothetical protein